MRPRCSVCDSLQLTVRNTGWTGCKPDMTAHQLLLKGTCSGRGGRKLCGCLFDCRCRVLCTLPAVLYSRLRGSTLLLRSSHCVIGVCQLVFETCSLLKGLTPLCLRRRWLISRLLSRAS